MNTAGSQTITVKYGGLTGSETVNILGESIDAVPPTGVLSSFNSNGTAIRSGYTGGGTPESGLAVDAAGDFFSVDTSENLLTQFNSSGTALSGSGFKGGGLACTLAARRRFAMSRSGHDNGSMRHPDSALIGRQPVALFRLSYHAA